MSIEIHPNYSYIFNFENDFIHQDTRVWMVKNWTYVFYYSGIYMAVIFCGQQFMKSRPRFVWKHIYLIFFVPKRRLSSSSANMPIWRYFFYESVRLFSSQANAYPKREAYRKHAKCVWCTFWATDITTKNILLCAKNVKKRNKYFFYYHWIFVNPVKNSKISNLIKWWRVNILLLFLLFQHTSPVMLNELKLIK